MEVKLCKRKLIKDDVKINLVSWHANKVLSISTYIGSQPTGTKQRLLELKYVVDLLDSMLRCYHIKIKIKKWYIGIVLPLVKYVYYK